MEKRSMNSSISSDQYLMPFLNSVKVQTDNSFDDDQDDIDQDRCYIMEIEQLKRENSFLKKKIAELNKKHFAFGYVQKQRRSLPANIKPPVPITHAEPQHYIVVFFQQVTRLLDSFSQLFRVAVPNALAQHVAKQQQNFQQLTKKHQQDLHRRLERLLLVPEEKRFSEMLSIFDGFYRDTVQKGKQLKHRVEQLTTQAIQLGKKMAENIRNREKSKESRLSMMSIMSEDPFQSQNCLKESEIRSTCPDEPIQMQANEKQANVKLF